MASAPIILVPGFWLGAWAWDEVAAPPRGRPRRHRAHAARASSRRTPIVTITFMDHVDAIIDAVEAADRPAVLAVHSASGFTGYVASDRVPDRIAAMVYVDTAPGKPPLDPDSRRRSGVRLGGGQGGEPRRPVRGAEGHDPGASGAGPGGDRPRGVRVHERRPTGHPEHAHRDRLHRRGLPEVREGTPDSSFLAGHPGAAQPHLDRPPDEPLADVVEAEGDREDHRRRRDGPAGGGR